MSEPTPWDKLKEECGVFAIYGHPEAANMAYLGLYALQHRGQESAGIVSSDGTTLHVEVGMGLVADVFDERRLQGLPGFLAIGHNRYSTSGQSQLRNAQPMTVEYSGGSMALAHNGNLVNFEGLRSSLESAGSIFRSSSDSEVLLHLAATSGEKTLVGRVVEALRKVQGAYSLVVISERELVAARDPRGFRPLVLGRLDEAYVVASETCALDLIEATPLRDVEPGEVLLIDENGLTSFHPMTQASIHHCIFEFIYFARPDSALDGLNVSQVRRRLGRRLAIECPVDADLVVPVPDSGTFAALGYSEESGIPYEPALIRNHYVGRTFIEPRQSIRHFGVKVKLNAVRNVIQGKRVVLVDDSIVRGITSRKIVQMVRNAGALEVHLRISSAPITHSCFYGIDTPTHEELIASELSQPQIAQHITADTIGYLSLEGMRKAVASAQDSLCVACFDGSYPVPVVEPALDQLRLFERIG